MTVTRFIVASEIRKGQKRMNHDCFLIGLFKRKMYKMYNMTLEADLLEEAIKGLLKKYEKGAKR